VRSLVSIGLALALLACGSEKPSPASLPLPLPAPDLPSIPSSLASPAPLAVTYLSLGETVSAEIFLPSTPFDSMPGLIAIHEWWGLNDQVRKESMRRAEEGYVVLAVNLYRGPAATDTDQAHELSRGLPEDRALRDLRAAYEFLSHYPDIDSGAIGVVGWCMGGGHALNLAVAEPRLGACAIYYGRLPTDRETLNRIRAPVIGFFGMEDRGISADAVRAFEKTMKELRKDIEVHLYPGAGHAFANSERPSYREDAATDAWAREKAFFAKNL
jgi:carboxymethylenebutenolidase